MATPKQLQKAKKYYDLAKYNATLFSKDPHRQVCSYILTEDFSRVLATGLNGLPRNMDDTNMKRWERPEKYYYCVHSEMSAVCNAARSGTAIDNSVCVVTLHPCASCAKCLIQAGIKRVYTTSPDFDDPRWGKDFKVAREMFDEVGVDVIYVDTEKNE
jgi:dCMP deaminase